MQQPNTAMKATGGRAASRERRAQLVQGKAGLPPARERSRSGEHVAQAQSTAAPAARIEAAQIATTPAPIPVTAPATHSSSALTGRDASRARRAGLVQGKGGLQQLKTAMIAAAPLASASIPVVAGNGRQVAQALRTARAKNGRGEAAASTRPSGRVRNPEALQYPPKVVETRTYAEQRVTGVRIGRGGNVTGDEPGAGLAVTGSQYIGTETGQFTPRAGGVKVGAARTVAGQVVTGTQVRSKIMITGDESNAAIRITGEADQEFADDLIQRREQGAYAASQFQRQSSPHGHTVFGTNLGRSIKAIGSRQRDSESDIAETTDGGHRISGTAVGRSAIMTGDEPGTCRSITGSQYLKPADRQPLCDTAVPAAKPGSRRMGGGKAHGETETWTRQRITGVEVEFKPGVTGDEPGACATITGTPYVGPAQYEVYCESGKTEAVASRVTGSDQPLHRVTGNLPLHSGQVTGTDRGGTRLLTGTPYYQKDAEADMTGNTVKQITERFTVRTPQRDAQLRADSAAAKAPSAEGRITGTFAAGAGKITGNQEFHFAPRAKVEREDSKSHITGEGRMEGPAITGGAWGANTRITGTEGCTARERNPSERAGKPQAFANASLFKGKGNHEAPTQHVTGMVGWSAKTAARVTLSGGAQG